MRDLTSLRANLRSHKGSLFGIFVLMLIVTAAFAAVSTVWQNSRTYICGEMDRLGYGDLTAWVSGISDTRRLMKEAEVLPDVESVEEQKIVIANYEVGAQESDSEGQLISYTPETFPYRFFNDDLSGYQSAPGTIHAGDIYVSASLISMFGVQPGDGIQVIAARNGVTYPLVIKGFFEDPFMGSTMIGMKSFLISEKDRKEILRISENEGIDALARGGAMLHVTQREGSTLAAADLNELLNRKTSMAGHAEFVHSKQVLAGFMLILQNIFTALMLAFVIILLVATILVLGHALGSSLEQDTVNMGILKTVGYTSGKLRQMQIVQYLIPVLLGSLAGFALSSCASRIVSRMTLTTTGVLIPSILPVGIFASGFVVIMALLLLFIVQRTASVVEIPPVTAIQRGAAGGFSLKSGVPFKQRHLQFWMAFRQLLSGKKRYISSCLIAVLLVFFASLVGRMNAWLGPNGEGLMDAFNPADLDLGVQIFSDLSRGEVEELINGISPITDYYELAMENVTLNGVDYRANIISDPERLHILKGRACTGENEVVLTEFLAADLGLGIGDRVSLSAQAGRADFIITGLYQCANDMGDNFALSRKGYLAVAYDDPRIWCFHYFLQDPEKRITVMETLEEKYKVDIHVHENAWPGLYGIIEAMRNLMLFLYFVAAVVIFTAVMLSGSKILNREQHDLTVYRTLGFKAFRLRVSFALRFCIVAAAGGVIGTVLSAFLTDPLVDRVMRMSGISGFSSRPGLLALLFPAVTVVFLFTGFAYMVSGRIKRMELNTLISE